MVIESIIVYLVLGIVVLIVLIGFIICLFRGKW